MLSKDTKLGKHWTAIFENIRNRWCLLLSLYFISYFTQFLKIGLADIRYLLLWCVTNSQNCVSYPSLHSYHPDSMFFLQWWFSDHRHLRTEAPAKCLLRDLPSVPHPGVHRSLLPFWFPNGGGTRGWGAQSAQLFRHLLFHHVHISYQGNVM